MHIDKLVIILFEGINISGKKTWDLVLWDGKYEKLMMGILKSRQEFM
jgi:hypothetical protein